jgi:hypothetical protein
MDGVTTLTQVSPGEAGQSTLIVKGTDLQYVQQLAAEAQVFYVDPGPAPGSNTAYWGPEIKADHPDRRSTSHGRFRSVPVGSSYRIFPFDFK